LTSVKAAGGAAAHSVGPAGVSADARFAGLRRRPMTHVALRVIREEHATLAAMLQSLQRLLEHGHEVDGGEGSTRYFDVLRAMLFYIDEFPCGCCPQRRICSRPSTSSNATTVPGRPRCAT
jgi:hypothetical protein